MRIVAAAVRAIIKIVLELHGIKHEWLHKAICGIIIQ